jgi:uncharacterized membrane protein HdeD (DUF308 family)
MSDDIGSTTTPGGTAPATDSLREALARQWKVVLATGIVTFGLGVVLAAWPGETVTVLALLLAFQLIVAGAAQMFIGFVTAGPRRWTLVLGGVVSLAIGVLFLFNPLQTLTFIGWIIGICVVAVGVADLFGAFMTEAPRHRAWQVVRGLLGVVIGLFLVANPDWSLGAMVVIAIVWLIGYGSITIFAALALRSEEKRVAA